MEAPDGSVQEMCWSKHQHTRIDHSSPTEVWVKVFPSEKVSQDPIEKFFGCQRQRGRVNENPNAQEFLKNTQALRVINGMCPSVTRGNCRGNTEQQKLDATPLHKRSRPRPKKISLPHAK